MIAGTLLELRVVARKNQVMVHRVVLREQRKYYTGVVQFQPASATIIDSLNVILVRKKIVFAA